MPFSFGTSVMNEGAFAQLSCVVTEGDEPLAISWSFHGNNLTSDLGIQTGDLGSRASVLMIGSVGHGHMGSYTCTAANKAGKATHTADLRVNGRLDGVGGAGVGWGEGHRDDEINLFLFDFQSHPRSFRSTSGRS